MFRVMRSGFRRPARIAPASELDTNTLDAVSVAEQERPSVVGSVREEDGQSCGTCCGLFQRKPHPVVPTLVRKNTLASLFRRKTKVKSPLAPILRRSCAVKMSRAQTDLLNKLPDRDPDESDTTVGSEAAEEETEPHICPPEEENAKDEAEEAFVEPLCEASSGGDATENEESPAVIGRQDETDLTDNPMSLEEIVPEPLFAASSHSATEDKEEVPAVVSVADDVASLSDSVEVIDLEDGVPTVEHEADTPEDPILRPSPRIAWEEKVAYRYIPPRKKKTPVRPTNKDPVPRQRQTREMFDTFRFCCLYPFINCFGL